VTFSVATDSSIGPGAVMGSAVTYTPQNNPHFYVSWRGQMLGPSANAAEVAPTIQVGRRPQTVLPDVRSVLVTNFASSGKNEQTVPATSLPAASITMHAGVTLEGVVGLQYGIQYKKNLTDTNDWRGLANIILTTPKQVWYDPQSTSNPQGYYRIVSGPIAIP